MSMAVPLSALTSHELARIALFDRALADSLDAALTYEAGLDVFTSALKGLAPASGGGTTNYLRADGTWTTPPGVGAGLGWYVVTSHGLVADGTTDNKTAFATLLATVDAAGGGTIYFPRGEYYFSITPGTGSINFQALGACNIRLLGDGPASVLSWGGNAGGGAGDLFRMREGVSHVTVEKLRFVQKNLTNPDGGEQHHCFHLITGLTGGGTGGDIHHMKFIDCEFGVFKGDAFRLVGQIDWDACKANIAGTVASGALAGPFNSPTEPQRMSVKYPAGWDGGTFTVTGTDINDMVISEIIPAAVNDTAVGYKYFKTVTGISKSLTGLSANTANIGFAYEVHNIEITQCYFNGFEYLGTDPGYGYRSCITAQRLARNIFVTHNFFTGSDDQMLDFEPTGNGDQSAWIVEHNVFKAESVALGFPPVPCITLIGNGNTTSLGSLLLESSSFSHNVVHGRVSCAKLRNVKIKDNFFTPDQNTGITDGVLAFSDSVINVEIDGNIFLPEASFTGKLIGIEAGSGFAGSGARIRDNVFNWYGGSSGINCVDVTDLEISGNKFVYWAATTNTDNGITTSSSTVDPHSRLRILNNFFQGDFGGGTLKWAINIGATNPRGIIVIGNDGSGVQTRGVSLPAGTYTEPPIVVGNGFLGATDPLLIGAGVLVSQWSPNAPATITTGNLDKSASVNKLSIDGTKALTLPNGVVAGQRMIVECTVATSTPIGTLTVTTPLAGDPSTYIFNTVGQLLEFKWDGAAWRCIRKIRAGSQTPVLGTTTISSMVSTVNLSITGTVSGALPPGAVVGEMVQVRCTTAASTPAGSLTGTYKGLDAAATTSAAINDTADYFIATWDGAAWLVTNSNSVVFS